jgi:hypothetical protein
MNSTLSWRVIGTYNIMQQIHHGDAMVSVIVVSYLCDHAKFDACSMQLSDYI